MIGCSRMAPSLSRSAGRIATVTRVWKRLLWLVAGLLLVLVLLALVYASGMHWLEGSPRSFWAALGWSAETLTTTGYGADDSWSHPAMVLFVGFTQFLGVFLVFLIVPVYLIPLLEQRFEARLPRKLSGVENHVLICRYGPAVAGLISDLEAERRRVVVLEPEEARARVVAGEGIEVILGGVDERALEAAGVLSASALVANGADDENAAAVVAARQLGFTGTVVALVADPAHRRAIELAGASSVVSPKLELGAALAHRASPSVTSSAGLFSCGPALRLEPIRVPADSSLAGKRLAEMDLSGKWKVSAVGQWVGGRLDTDLAADSVVEPDGTLIVAGASSAIEQLRAEVNGRREPRFGRHVVGGFGEVGRRVVELLHEAGQEVMVIDHAHTDGVDLEADILAPETLERAELAYASSVVLALDSDAATLFATLLVRDLAPSVPLVVRVNDARNLDNIHRAGASYAVSLDQVAGQILSGYLMGEESITLDPRLKVLRVKADRLAGVSLVRSGIRERTGSTIIAVERDGDLQVDLAPSFSFASGDIAYVCGSPTAVRRARDWVAAR